MIINNQLNNIKYIKLIKSSFFQVYIIYFLKISTFTIKILSLSNSCFFSTLIVFNNINYKRNLIIIFIYFIYLKIIVFMAILLMNFLFICNRSVNLNLLIK